MAAPRLSISAFMVVIRSARRARILSMRSGVVSLSMSVLTLGSWCVPIMPPAMFAGGCIAAAKVAQAPSCAGVILSLVFNSVWRLTMRSWWLPNMRSRMLEWSPRCMRSCICGCAPVAGAVGVAFCAKAANPQVAIKVVSSKCLLESFIINP